MGLDLFFKRVSEEEVGYFRKVNFLIPFFEERTGNEIENCELVYITKEDIEELIRRCKEVLDNHEDANVLLPTTTGFFYGSDEYDEYYFDNVKKVLEYCQNDLLPMFDELTDDEYIAFKIWY